MAHQINQNEMDALLSELEIGLAPMLKSAKDAAAAKLSKSGEGPESSAGGDDKGGSPAPAAGGDEGGSAPASASGDASAPPASPSPDAGASAPASPSADPAAGDPGAGAPADPAELEAAYAQLPVEQLKMHYIAAKSALFQKMQGGAPGGDMGGAPAGAPPAGPGGSPSAPPAPPAGAPGGSPSAPPPPPPGASPDPAMKSENDALKDRLAKMEQSQAAQDEVVGKLSKALGLLLKPERKAVTGVTFIAKSEDQKPADSKPVDFSKLSKNEVTALLKPKMDAIIKSGKTADMNAIKDFYNGDVGVDAIKHLLG